VGVAPDRQCVSKSAAKPCGSFLASDRRIIHEPAPGLTPARLRAITEAEGEIIIFVDDGNVLDPSYLSESMRIACNFPAWVRGAGNSFRNLKSHLLRDWKTCLGLALRKLQQARWSNYDSSTSPKGAGLCVRASVAGRYAKNAVSDLIRRSLDRWEGTSSAEILIWQ
jgi:glycosyltransferase involved in cell wall biosynthesis